MGQQGIADTERQVPSGGAGALLSWSPQGKRSRQLGAGAAVRGKGFEAGPGLQLPLQEPGAPHLARVCFSASPLFCEARTTPDLSSGLQHTVGL